MSCVHRLQFVCKEDVCLGNRINKKFYHLPSPLRTIISIMPPVLSLPQRAKCMQCRCRETLFGARFDQAAMAPTEACTCNHPWWQHLMTSPSTGRGACPASFCGGYHPMVVFLITMKVKLFTRPKLERITYHWDMRLRPTIPCPRQ
jgi:hypothetical protein